MKMKTPWLRKIDLRKITEKDNFTTHPDIDLKCQYLIKYGRDYCAGRFSKQWFGLVFEGHPAYLSIELDDDDIKGIWQIRTVG